MNVVLISTYELGHQPFGLASPAAWLAEIDAKVTCLDLSREDFREAPIRDASLIAFYVPMHTATRLAIALLPRVRELNPRAHICFYGLYAPVNAKHLRDVGAQTILGGEFEQGLADLVGQLTNETPVRNFPEKQNESVISLGRQQFRIPDARGTSAAREVRAPDYARRWIPHCRVHRGQPRLQTSLPPLSDCPGV